MIRPGRLARALLGAGLLAWPLAACLDWACGAEVTLLARVRTPAEREAWRRTGWDARDGVAELYGWVEPPPGLRVILVDDDRVLRPPEAPGLLLLSVDRRRGEDVLTARALHGRAALLAALLLAGGAFLAWRRARAVTAPRPASRGARGTR